MSEGGGYDDMLPKKTQQLLYQQMGADEHVEFCLVGLSGQTLVALDRRILIIKRGWLAGATFGAKVTTFAYGDITGIEVRTGAMRGWIELTTPSFQGQVMPGLWTGDRDRNVYKLPYCLPFRMRVLSTYQPYLDQLRERISGVRPLPHAVFPSNSVIGPSLSNEDEETMEHCGQCGAQLAGEHRFCPSCGVVRNLDSPGNPDDDETADDLTNDPEYLYIQALERQQDAFLRQTPPKKKHNSFVKTMILAAVILAIFGVAVMREGAASNDANSGVDSSLLTPTDPAIDYSSGDYGDAHVCTQEHYDTAQTRCARDDTTINATDFASAYISYSSSDANGFTTSETTWEIHTLAPDTPLEKWADGTDSTVGTVYDSVSLSDIFSRAGVTPKGGVTYYINTPSGVAQFAYWQN